MRIPVACCLFVIVCNGLPAQGGEKGKDVEKKREKPSAWQKQPQGVSFSGETLSLRILPSGQVKEIKYGGVVIITELMLYGDYVAPGKKHDTRFFQQSFLSEQKPLLARKGKDGILFVQKKGVLKNKKYPRAATFTQKMRLTKRSLEFHYEVTTLVPLATRSQIFKTLCYLPPKTFAGRGYRLVSSRQLPKLKVFPKAYSPAAATDIRSIKSKSIRVVMDAGHLFIASGKNSEFYLSDTRAYGGKFLRINFQPRTVWRPKTVTYKAGTHFVWSFRLVTLGDFEKSSSTP